VLQAAHWNAGRKKSPKSRHRYIGLQSRSCCRFCWFSESFRGDPSHRRPYNQIFVGFAPRTSMGSAPVSSWLETAGLHQLSSACKCSISYRIVADSTSFFVQHLFQKGVFTDRWHGFLRVGCPSCRPINSDSFLIPVRVRSWVGL